MGKSRIVKYLIVYIYTYKFLYIYVHVFCFCYFNVYICDSSSQL